MHFDKEHIEQILETMEICGLDYVVNLSMPQDPDDFMSMLEKSNHLGQGKIATLSHFLYDDGVQFRKDTGIRAKPLSFGKIDQPGVVDGLVKRFRQEVATGSKGLKVLKKLGLWAQDSNGDYITVDDERLDPIWATAAELDVPVLIHTADPPGAWLAENAGSKYYWGDKQYFSNIELLEQRDRMMERHPKTVFVCAHLGYARDLDHLVELLERFPNYCGDMGGSAISLTPPGKKQQSHRDVIIKYADRFCFGTDIYLKPGQNCDHEWNKNCYERHEKWMSTAENNGLDLPDEVMVKILFKNPKRIYQL